MPLLRRDSACSFFLFFFFNDTAPTEIYTLSLHDALPIFPRAQLGDAPRVHRSAGLRRHGVPRGDRKSTRLNSSHDIISYAVFCLKKMSLERPEIRNCLPGEHDIWVLYTRAHR